MEKAELKKVLVDVLREIAELQGISLPEGDIPDEFRLMGSSSLLDSMAFVMLTSGIEQQLYEKYNVSVTIVNEKAMSMKNSPFRTLGALADYVHHLIGPA